MSYFNINKSISKENFYLSFFFFDAPIGIVWNIIKDPTLIQILNKGYNFTNINNILINKNIITSYEIGTKFQNYFDKSSHFIYEIENIIETDYFCKIIWKCSLINNPLNLPEIKCIFDLYYNENKTIFTALYIIPKYYNKIFLINQEKKRQKYYTFIERYIVNNDYLKYFNLSININGDYNKACILLYDIKLITSLYSEIISYNSNFFIKNNELIIRIRNKNFNNGKQITVKYIVGDIIKYNIIPRTIYEIYLFSNECSAKIIFICEKINENSFVLYVYFNLYKGFNQKNNNFWKEMTKKIFLKISQIFEKI